MRLSLGVHYRRCSSCLRVNRISGINVYRIVPCVFSHKNWHYNFCDGCWVIAIFCVGFGIFLPTNINIGVRMWFQQCRSSRGTLKTIDRAFVQNDIDTVVGFVFVVGFCRIAHETIRIKSANDHAAGIIVEQHNIRGLNLVFWFCRFPPVSASIKLTTTRGSDIPL